MMADGFDHFNGDEFVKCPPEITVIFFQHRDLIFEPCISKSFCGKLILFVGDGGGGYLYAVILSRMDGKSPPTGANLHHPVSGM